MARLTILIALLAAFLLVAHTCASQCGCQKQLQRVNLRPCEKHIIQRIQQQEEEEEEEEDVLNFQGIHYNILPRRGGQQQQEEQEVEQYCCKQLSELNSPKCQCQALQYIMERLSEQLQGKEMQQLQKELNYLPSRCGLGPLRRCDLSCED